MLKIKKDKSIPSWNDISSKKESEAQSADTRYEDLMDKLEKEREEEFDRMVERNRNYNMEDGQLERDCNYPILTVNYC
jgi:hypothetical protein